jgi:hypothetical protein
VPAPLILAILLSPRCSVEIEIERPIPQLVRIDSNFRISSANRDALKIEGEADAEAARIYASACSAPDAQDLYLFLRTLDVARSAFENDTTAVISTNSDLGRMLKSMGGLGVKGNGLSVGFTPRANGIVVSRGARAPRNTMRLQRVRNS